MVRWVWPGNGDPVFLLSMVQSKTVPVNWCRGRGSQMSLKKFKLRDIILELPCVEELQSHPSTTTYTMFKPRVRIPRVSLPKQTPVAFFRRDLHQVPHLHVQGSPTTEGIAGLLSADGFNLAYTQYMQFTIEKLNALTAGQSTQHRHVCTFQATDRW